MEELRLKLKLRTKVEGEFLQNLASESYHWMVGARDTEMSGETSPRISYSFYGISQWIEGR